MVNNEMNAAQCHWVRILRYGKYCCNRDVVQSTISVYWDGLVLRTLPETAMQMTILTVWG
jgi:hypothetical protein